MKFNWFKKKEKTLTDTLSELSAVLDIQTTEVNEFGWADIHPAINGLPMVVVDDDFFEYLAEEGYDESIEYDELLLVYEDWETENVE